MSESKFDKSTIEGFPEGACTSVMGGVRRVFYAYCYNLGGKRFSERDYLGHIEDGKFIPNDYYRYGQPKRLPRPVEFWSNPEKRRIEEEKLKQTQKQQKQNVRIARKTRHTEELPEEPDEIYASSVGATAVCTAMLYESNYVSDLCKTVGDTQLVLDAVNLAIHAAITCDATYLAQPESKLQKFIGAGCPSSQRASEIHIRLGQIPELSMRIGKARCSRLNKGDLLALDGTRLDCNSDSITLGAVGKRKDGNFGRQINFSVLFNATSGEAVCYRAYAGNYNDVCTLADFRSLWKNFGISDYEPTIIADRGYYKGEELVNLNNDRIQFLVGGKTSLNCVSNIISEENSKFFDYRHLLEDRECFCVEKSDTIKSANGNADVKIFVYRDPVEGMRKVDELRKKLRTYQKNWMEGKIDSKSVTATLRGQKSLPEPEPDEIWDDKTLSENMLYFFKRPWKKKTPLELNETCFGEYCYTLGYFALITNANIDRYKALDDYGLRNEVEVFFKKQKDLMRTTRVQSDEALNGLLLTSFLAASIRIELVHRLKKARSVLKGEQSGQINSVSKLLTTLRRIRMIRYEDGHHELVDVTSNEKNLVEALGFPGLLDSAESVAHLLSAKRLTEESKKA